MNDATSQIETLRDQLEAGERGGSEAGREVLLAFLEQLDLRSTQYSDGRKLKLLRHCTLLSEGEGGLADAVHDRDAGEALVRWIHDNYDNPETNRDFRVSLRMFGKHLADGDVPTDDAGIPEALAWIPASTPSGYSPAPDPNEMLRWEADVVPMIEATLNSRDAAMIALQFDAGLRGGEFEGIQVGDVSDNEYGLQVTVDGKTGRRTVTLIPSVPYVQRWQSDHPRGDEDAAPLWCNLDTGEPISYRMKRKVFEQAARRAGVEKPVTPTNFRKSSAAHLASKGINQAHLEEHHGWVHGSRVASRYVSVFADDTSRALAETYGKQVEQSDDAEIAPLECVRCGRETPRERDICVWCGQALEPGAAETAEQLDGVLVEAIAAAEGERARKLVDMRDDIRRTPEIVDELVAELAPLLEED